MIRTFLDAGLLILIAATTGTPEESRRAFHLLKDTDQRWFKWFTCFGNYCAVQPPSIVRMEPVTYSAWSEQT